MIWNTFAVRLMMIEELQGDVDTGVGWAFGVRRSSVYNLSKTSTS